MPRIAFYPGSFDPITNGHLDVVRNSVSLCDRLVVAIGVHPGKKPLFSTEERLQMLHDVCGPLATQAGCVLEAVTFDDLAVTAARRHERGHGARGAYGVPAGLTHGSPDHRHFGAPDRRHGRGRLGLRPAAS